MSDRQPSPTEHPLAWFRSSSHPIAAAIRDSLSVVAVVAAVGLLLFAVAGVWPPLVAVESGSMEPHVSTGDLVLVVEPDRFASTTADETGVVPRASGEDRGHEQFGAPGSVVVFRPDGRANEQVIHRVAFAVERGENWVADADPEHLGRVETCADLPERCPAPHDGYVTRGDANANYDQIYPSQSTVVRPQWIEGRAATRVPYLGCVRLALTPGEGC